MSTNLTNDLIDIILEDDRLKEKLLMTYVKNSKNSEYYEKVTKGTPMQIWKSTNNFLFI